MSNSRKKSVYSFIVLLLIVSIPILYQNCASQHDPGSENFSSTFAAGKCTQIKIQGFQSTGYYDFVVANCVDCHTSSGIGAGPFADSNALLAGQSFVAKSEERIAEFAVSNHKAGYTGPQLQPEVDELREAWQPIEEAFIECANATGQPGVGGGQVDPPSKFTIAKNYQAPVGETTLMSWDLSTEMINAADNVPGVTLEMEIMGFDLGNELTGYYFMNPRIVVAGNEPIYFAGLGAQVDNQIVRNGTTWYTTDRFIPANDSRQLAPNGGAIVWVGDISVEQPIQIGFSEIGPAEIDFQPVTWDDLTQAGGILAVNCQGCHGNSGGQNLDNGNYNNIVGGTANSGLPLIQKYNLQESLIHARMNNEDAPMPPTGILPEAERNRVRDWILDGAPRDAQEVEDMR